MTHDAHQDSDEGRHITVTAEAVSYAIETQTAIKARLEGISYAALSRQIGVHKAVIRAIALGDFDHVSWHKLSVVRDRLGLPDYGQPVLTINGAKRKPRRSRRPTIAVRLTPADAALLDTLRQPGESRPAAIRRLLAQSKPGRW